MLLTNIEATKSFRQSSQLKKGHKKTKEIYISATDNTRIDTETLLSPSTNYHDSRLDLYSNVRGSPQDDFSQRFSFNHAKQLTESVSHRVQPIPKSNEIQKILNENEKLRICIDAKQKIIDTINKSRENIRLKARMDLQNIVISQRNSRSLLQPKKSEEKQAKPNHQFNEFYGMKQSVSQNYKRTMPKLVKLPFIEDTVPLNSPKEDIQNFTFANNFFKPIQSSQTPGSSRVNMLKAFPQYHLKKKFFT